MSRTCAYCKHFIAQPRVGDRSVGHCTEPSVSPFELASGERVYRLMNANEFCGHHEFRKESKP